MNRAIISNSHSAICRKLRSFSKNVEGLAAVEFAYVLPLMLLMFLGSFEISRAISMDRKVNAVAAITGDLVARERAVDPGVLASIMNIVNEVLAPYDPADLRVAVVPIQASNNNPPTAFVYANPFQHGGSISVPGRCSTYNLQNVEDILAPGATAIVVEVEYDYRPVFAEIFAGLQSILYNTNLGNSDTYTARSIHSPREGCVDFEDNQCIVNCP